MKSITILLAALLGAIALDAILIFAPAGPARAHDVPGQAAAWAVIAGHARVIDGDTIGVSPDGRREITVRLHGIDSPEMKQPCRMGGVVWACGPAAKAALERVIGRKTVTCRLRDIHHGSWGDRPVSVCTVSRAAVSDGGGATKAAVSDGGGAKKTGRTKPLDLAASMLRRGWAVAYRKYLKPDDPLRREYIALENAAMAARRGIHTGKFIAPSKWRHRKARRK